MPTDFNQFTFVDQARLVHGYRYDYLPGARYRGIDQPIKIACRLHGEFELTPNQHLIGEGCPFCAQAEQKVLI